MFSRIAVLSAIALSLGACAYKVQPITIAAHNVVTSYSEKIPGRWLVSVEGAALDEQTKSSSMACSAHKFPLLLSGPFQSSVVQTLPNIFAEVEQIPSPIPGDQVKARGARGIIVVRGEEARSRLDIQPGFWSANMKGELTVIASVYVDGPNGRIYGSTIEGRGVADADAGAFCAGGAKSLGDAAQTAIQDTMRRLAEGLGNSERLRSGR